VGLWACLIILTIIVVILVVVVVVLTTIITITAIIILLDALTPLLVIDTAILALHDSYSVGSQLLLGLPNLASCVSDNVIRGDVVPQVGRRLRRREPCVRGLHEGI
jgi:hypothetical protein